MTTFAYTSGDPSHLSSSQNASMADLQGPLIDIRTFLNGNITDINLSASAAISETKLAVGSSGMAKGSFSAYRNAALSLATGAFVTYDAEEWDTSGWFDISNGRYTPQVAGIYRLSWIVTANVTLGGGQYVRTDLYKNAAAIKIGIPDPSSGAGTYFPSSGHSALVQANGTTDYFQVQFVQNTGGAVGILPNAWSTYFQGELVGRS